MSPGRPLPPSGRPTTLSWRPVDPSGRPITILCCGGRAYADYDHVHDTLNAITVEFVPAELHIVHGGAPGADSLCGKWAERYGIKVTVYPAHWRSGPSAGPRRNARMLAESRPDLVVAFPGGRGTRDMVLKARAAKVVVFSVGAAPRYGAVSRADSTPGKAM